MVAVVCVPGAEDCSLGAEVGELGVVGVVVDSGVVEGLVGTVVSGVVGVVVDSGVVEGLVGTVVSGVVEGVVGVVVDSGVEGLVGTLVGEAGVVDESGVEGIEEGTTGVEVGLTGVAAGVADSTAGFSIVGMVGLLVSGFSMLGIEVGVEVGVICKVGAEVGVEVGTTGTKPGFAGVVLIDGVSGFAIGERTGVLERSIMGVVASAGATVEGFLTDSAIVGTAYPANTAAATPKAAICFRLLTIDLQNLLKG
ncbi:MAG: hypothetical protein MUC48_12375 [Leptolyngbya sp. Prado105]|nr:hypothetical protein [Leptolyngbya sp. Prado105]